MVIHYSIVMVLIESLGYKLSCGLKRTDWFDEKPIVVLDFVLLKCSNTILNTNMVYRAKLYF